MAEMLFDTWGVNNMSVEEVKGVARGTSVPPKLREKLDMIQQVKDLPIPEDSPSVAKQVRRYNKVTQTDFQPVDPVTGYPVFVVPK